MVPTLPSSALGAAVGSEVVGGGGRTVGSPVVGAGVGAGVGDGDGATVVGAGVGSEVVGDGGGEVGSPVDGARVGAGVDDGDGATVVDVVIAGAVGAGATRLKQEHMFQVEVCEIRDRCTSHWFHCNTNSMPVQPVVASQRSSHPSSVSVGCTMKSPEPPSAARQQPLPADS